MLSVTSLKCIKMRWQPGVRRAPPRRLGTRAPQLDFGGDDGKGREREGEGKGRTGDEGKGKNGKGTGRGREEKVREGREGGREIGASIPPNANDANSPSPSFPSSFPSPSLPSSLPSLFPFPIPLSPFPPPSSPPFPFSCREAAPWTAMGLGERFSFPSGVRGGAPAANPFWVNLAQETHLVAATYNTIISMTHISGGNSPPPLRVEFFPPLSQTGRKLRPLPPL